jgi:hypothetical protein
MNDSDYIKQLEATIEQLQVKLAVLEVENEDLVNQRDSAEEDVRYYRNEARLAEHKGSDEGRWDDP